MSIKKFNKKIKNLWFRYKVRKASLPEKADLLRPLFFHMGNNVEFHSNRWGREPDLISVEDNVCVAAGVCFINHDVSCFRMAEYLGLPRTAVDKVGPIILKNNCFVGAYSYIMPNVTIGKNSVIAACSVVTKSVPDGEFWGGVPAKFIMKTEEYAHKVVDKSSKWPWTAIKEEIPYDQLVKMRQEYFFKDYKIE